MSQLVETPPQPPRENPAKEPVAAASTKPSRRGWFIAPVLLLVTLCLSWLLSSLATVHPLPDDPGYYPEGVPSIMGLLNSSLFMGFIFVVTLGVVAYVLYLFWCLHEVAVHRAKALESVNTQLVFALSLCGLFIDKAWWVLAIIIAFARWDVVAKRISAIIGDGIKGGRQ